MSTATIRTDEHTIRIDRPEREIPSDGIYPQFQLGPPTYTIDGEDATEAEARALLAEWQARQPT